MDIQGLVDVHSLRTTVVRRLFKNHPAEVLEELFQNAQRAGAQHVSITTTETSLAIKDDGHGIDGMEGFQTLLQIAATHYADPTVAENQHPMGVGIQSLLAFEGVNEVVFRSGTHTVRIDTQRWWDDLAYAVQWKARVERHDSVQGFEIEIYGTPATMQAVHATLQTTCYCYPFTLSLDGVVLPNRLPDWAIPSTVLFETTYQGNRLLVGYNRYQAYRDQRSCVNWYGQVIRTSLETNDRTPFMFYLEVTQGRPVNPIAPTRQSIIDDESFKTLRQFVCHAIYDYLFDPTNRDAIKPEWVTECYRLLPERCAAAAPLFVAHPWHDVGMHVECVEDMHPLTDTPTILSYADQPLVLESSVMLVHADETMEAFEYGMTSFLAAIDRPAYHVVCGNPARLHPQRLYWKPGALLDGVFFEAGAWALGVDDSSLNWQPIILEQPVYVFDSADCWRVDNVDFLVGLPDASWKRVFYETYAWSGHDRENDRYDGETLYDAYAESCRSQIRSLVGQCIPPIDVAAIKEQMAVPSARLTTITFVYAENRQYPHALRAVNEHGEEKELTFL